MRPARSPVHLHMRMRSLVHWAHMHILTDHVTVNQLARETR